MKNSKEINTDLFNRKGRLLEERFEINKMIKSMEKQIQYLSKRLDSIDIEVKDINKLRSHILESE